MTDVHFVIGKDGRGSLALDGRDVSENISGVTIEAQVGKPTQVTLRLVPAAVSGLADAELHADVGLLLDVCMGHIETELVEPDAAGQPRQAAMPLVRAHIKRAIQAALEAQKRLGL